MKNSTDQIIIDKAKALRKTMTDAEQKLWYRLRAEQLGFKFRRQHPFLHFVLDFVCLEKKLVVEVDGSQHVDDQIYDKYRTECLKKAGFTVLRFWNNQVLVELDDVVTEIYRHLHKPSNPSNPSNPSPP